MPGHPFSSHPSHGLTVWFLYGQDLLNSLSLQEKIGQMTQLDIRMVRFALKLYASENGVNGGLCVQFGAVVGTEFVLNETALNITFDRMLDPSWIVHTGPSSSCVCLCARQSITSVRF
jgi:hypothetical protein